MIHETRLSKFNESGSELFLVLSSVFSPWNQVLHIKGLEEAGLLAEYSSNRRFAQANMAGSGLPPGGQSGCGPSVQVQLRTREGGKLTEGERTA
jgi:hypothetical protein